MYRRGNRATAPGQSDLADEGNRVTVPATTKLTPHTFDPSEHALLRAAGAHSDLYRLLKDVGPHDGGCLLVALALLNIYRGDLYAGWSRHHGYDQPEHVVLKVEAGYLDADGFSSEDEILCRLPRGEWHLAPVTLETCLEYGCGVYESRGGSSLVTKLTHYFRTRLDPMSNLKEKFLEHASSSLETSDVALERLLGHALRHAPAATEHFLRECENERLAEAGFVVGYLNADPLELASMDVEALNDHAEDLLDQGILSDLS